MPLCEGCQKFDLQSFKSDPLGQRGYSVEEVLQQLARSPNCEFCSFLGQHCHDRWPGAYLHLEVPPENMASVRAGKDMELRTLRMGLRDQCAFPRSIVSGYAEGEHHSITKHLHVFAEEGERWLLESALIIR